MNPGLIIRHSTFSATALGLLLAPACVPMDELSQYKGGGAAGGAGTSPGGSGAAGDGVGSGGYSGSSSSGSDTRLTTLADAGNAGGKVQPADAGLAGSDTDAAAAPCSGAGEVPGTAQESCYLFSTQAANWLAAELTCSFWGGHLATLGTPDEDAFFTQHISADNWLGLNDIATEGSFVWIDGSALGYTHWAAQEPNNSNNGDCAEKRVSDGFWYDQPCATAKAYACEQPLAPAAPSL